MNSGTTWTSTESLGSDEAGEGEEESVTTRPANAPTNTIPQTAINVTLSEWRIATPGRVGLVAEEP